MVVRNFVIIFVNPTTTILLLNTELSIRWDWRSVSGESDVTGGPQSDSV